MLGQRRLMLYGKYPSKLKDIPFVLWVMVLLGLCRDLSAISGQSWRSVWQIMLLPRLWPTRKTDLCRNDLRCR
ncbi:hypothetical protein E2C01_060218 [Portunus trituberculatus]|uniref:Uncharacterized protein n=1 Tax=Portunus trituberculatus TaxID=210409 RepID=A0A5B7H8P3_PORTR|nr:hypothetical protein [Portunus trituberculatus]